MTFGTDDCGRPAVSGGIRSILFRAAANGIASMSPMHNRATVRI